MLVNEGLAGFMVDRAVKMLDGSLWGKTVGLLGLRLQGQQRRYPRVTQLPSKKGT